MGSAEPGWQRLTTALAGLLDGAQIADLLWMAQLMALESGPVEPQADPAPLAPPEAPEASALPTSWPEPPANPTPAPPPAPPPDIAPAEPPPPPAALVEPATGAEPLPANAPRVSVAEAQLLARPRRIARALAPLSRQVASGPARELDVPATVEAIARARVERTPWQPVLRPRREAWLHLDLVFDSHPSMALWQRLRRELPRTLAHQIRWRDLRSWRLVTSAEGVLRLVGSQGHRRGPDLPRQMSGRELVLVVSDAIGPGWRDGSLARLLNHWAARRPVVLLQVLPPRLWPRTGLGQQEAGWVQARGPLITNAHLRWHPVDPDNSPLDPPPAGALTLPLATLDPDDLAAMARLLAGGAHNSLRGARFAPREAAASQQESPPPAPVNAEPDGEAIERQLALFLFSASGGARRLLAMLSFAPVITLPVVRLIQRRQGMDGGPAQIAEVLFSGLFRNVAAPPAPGAPVVPPDRQRLRFVAEDLRPRLREGLRVREAREVFDAVRDHVAANLERSVESFEALLRNPNAPPSKDERPLSEADQELLRAFATVSPRCLRGLGPRYEALADAIEEGWIHPPKKGPALLHRRLHSNRLQRSWIHPPKKGPALLYRRLHSNRLQRSWIHPPMKEVPVPEHPTDPPEAFPVLEPLEFETVCPEVAKLTPISFPTAVQKYDFGDPFQEWRGQGEWKRIDRKRQGWALEQPLCADGRLGLTLVRIPEGSFMMGSPENETGRTTNEGPQRQVELASFLMGQTPITQAQWREVAEWQAGEGECWKLELNPNPSRFQGKGKGNSRLLEGEITTDQRPVERVSLFDAMEFCNRLSQRTGRTYALPSEAQWEYACRAGTTTPFHFGETINADLANYDSNDIYGDGYRGVYWRQTTPVAQFPANAWGLHDMHGNVWEWCLDHWHWSYQGGPVDGSPWLADKSYGIRTRLLRGGSWNGYSRDCRSACRNHDRPDSVGGVVGFRVICLPYGCSS